MEIKLSPVGHVRGGRAAIMDDGWDAIEAEIELDEARFGPEALRGLDTFSHITVVFHFHRVDEGRIITSTRRLRDNPRWPENGIFAGPSQLRPSRIGVTTCRLLGVFGTCVKVRGLDAIDGTPVLDIKPWISGFGPRGETAEPEWTKELMARYW